MLSREHLRNYKPKTQKIELPELDGHVFVKSLTTKQLQEAERSREEGADSLDLLFRQVLCGVCNENGEPVFVADDKDVIASLPFAVVKRLSESVNDISGLGDDPKN